jgi:hypothetical protein
VVVDQVSRLQEQRVQLTAAELAAATLQADLVVAALRQSRDLREWSLQLRPTGRKIRLIEGSAKCRHLL